MTMQNDQPVSDQDAEKLALNKRLELIGWALFFIMIGCLWLMPDEWIPENTWLIGAGVILLGVNGVRRLYGIKMSACTLVLGIIAVLYGASGFFDVNVPFFPVLFVLIGVAILVSAFRQKARG